MSLRDTILTADDLEESVEDVPEWDVKILLSMYSDILIATALDPETQDLVFDPADREALAGKAGGVLERLALKVMKLSGVSVEDAEEEIVADPTSVGA